MAQYTYNGKTYNNLEELPSEARDSLEYKDNEKMPHSFEDILKKVENYPGLKNYPIGKNIYERLKNLSPEKKAILEEKLRSLANKDFSDKTEHTFNITQNMTQDVIPQSIRNEASQEVSSNFPYKAILGAIFILGAIASIILLIYILLNR